jgi:hypothetical protein
MKKLAFNAFVLLSLCLPLSAVSAYAQGNTLISRAEIPFDFSVRDRTLPAGTYSVTRIFPDVLLIRSEDCQEAIVTLTMPVQAKEIPETGELVFHRYGETYFLFQIWVPGISDGRQLLKSRTERSIERDSAENGAGPSDITRVVLSPRT